MSKMDVAIGVSSSASEGTVSTEKINNAALTRKVDYHIIPVVTILYLLSFIDRGNVGNAKIEGMAKDIGLVGNQFNIILTVFYLTYSPFEIPSNMIMNKLSPHVWLSGMMVAWAIVITLHGLVQSYGGLVTARLFLGITEAGLFPSVAYYLTQWYSRKEIQFRQALFYGAASSAGAFSGLLAYGISFMDGIGGQAGWRWIFYIEGLLTFVVAITSFFLIHDSIDSVKFLTDTEKAFLHNKLKNDRPAYVSDVPTSAIVPAEPEKTKAGLIAAIKDWQCYTHILVHWSIVTTNYALSLFMPTIIKGMGYTSAHAQLMSVPPYVAACIFSIGVAFLADKYNLRSPLIQSCHVVMIVGYIVAMSVNVTTHPNSVYGGIFITTVASFCAFPAMIAWLAINVEGPNKRGSAMALHIGIGNISGAMCTNFFRSQDAPKYLLGYGLEIMMCSVGFLSASFINFMYWRINKKRKADLQSGKYADYTPEQFLALGDKSPYFVYSH